MENERLKMQIDAGAMAQPVEEESTKGLTAQGMNLNYANSHRLAYLQLYCVGERDVAE